MTFFKLKKVQIKVLVLITLSSVQVFSQSKDEYYQKESFQYDNRIYKPYIKTVLLTQASWELGPPVIELNGDEKLKLSFDDLNASVETYNYTLIHCDVNWKPSNMVTSEYINGYAEDIISDYKYSFNTLQSYTHYNLIFPTQSMQLTKSGNYIIKVFKNYQPDSIVLSRRFMVYEPKVNIQAVVKRATLIIERDYKQEVDFTVSYPNYPIFDPFSDINIVILKNGRFDNAITNLKPLFIKQDQLVYDYDEKNTFRGGNEFRSFDIRSFRYQSERINDIKRDTNKVYHVYLLVDEARAFKRYFQQDDINGNYVIKVQEGVNSETDADYTYVHFYLNYPNPVEEGNIYLFGAFSNWKCLPEFKMKYNDKTYQYEAVLYLKQGYYNYQYAYLKDGTHTADVSLIEGTHSETENEYTILVYHRTMGTSYDQLIGVERVNSIQ